MEIKITICTPTFNRGHLLSYLYHSLKLQDFKEFEWLVIDDGSVDKTEELIKEFQNENIILIKYIRKKNGGKHSALNVGIDNAEGELFWIVDSDDYIAEEALQIVWENWRSIDKKNEFAGVAGLRAYSNNEIIGTTFLGNYFDTDSIKYRYKYNVRGDKAEVFATKVLKKNKFPEFEGEKYVTEALVWNRLANKGLKLRWFNKITYICEYLEGGLTSTSDRNIMDSWEGTTLYYKELLTYKEVPLKVKIFNGAKAYMHYCNIKGIGFKGILNITKNPLYVSMAYIVYLGKLTKRRVSYLVDFFTH